MGFSGRFHFAMGRLLFSKPFRTSPCVCGASAESIGHLEAVNTMIRKYLILLATDPATAPTGGQNGAASLDARSTLAEMLARRDAPEENATETSPTSSAEDDPEETDAPPAAVEPGQEDLPVEETPPAEGDEPQPEDEPTETEVPKAEGADKGLPEAVQKRIDKLTAQKYQTQEALDAAKAEVEQLRSEVEQLRSGAAVPSGNSPIPENVSKLKTVAEVTTRQQAVQAQLDELQDVLDENPGDSDTVIKIGQQEFTRGQLIAKRKVWRAEAQALPVHAQQLAAQQQATQQARQVNEMARQNHPWLADDANPETKEVREIVKRTGWTEITAAAYVRGMKSLKEEFAKKHPAAKPLTMTPPKPVAGKVPAAKPHTANGGAAGGKTAGVTIKTALDAHGKTGSRSSFAALLAARDGRG